jgi:hypothetical protein
MTVFGEYWPVFAGTVTVSLRWPMPGELMQSRGNPSISLRMAWFEINYSAEPTSKALYSEKVVARSRTEAAAEAKHRFFDVQSRCGASCYRIIDAGGMVVARGPH